MVLKTSSRVSEVRHEAPPSLLPLWDLLFGTALQPANWPRRYGMQGYEPQLGYLAQLADSF